MRFVGRWSYSCAKHLAIALNENHQKRAIYYYGFFVVIGAFVKAFFMMTVAAILGAVIPTALIIFVFGSLRMLAGGYHMDTYGKCLLVSMTMFVAAGLVSQYTFIYWEATYLAVLVAVVFAAGLYVLVRYAPKDTLNKPITKLEDVKKFKLLSIVYLVLWLIATSILTVYGQKMYVLAFSFGMLLELFAITPLGHRFFDFFKYRLGKVKFAR
jgi:accessory gene regulator B